MYPINSCPLLHRAPYLCHFSSYKGFKDVNPRFHRDFGDIFEEGLARELQAFPVEMFPQNGL
jgi:hypothetical protein